MPLRALPRPLVTVIALAIALATALAAPSAHAQPAATPARPASAANATSAAAPAAAPVAPAAPTRPAIRSWTGDRRDFAVGDIITVLVDDYTISSAIKDDQATQRRSRNLDVDVQKPGSGVTGGRISAGLSSRNDGNSQNRGEARRENRFQSEMSVRVVAVGPNNTLQVKGTRLVDVDKGRQDVLLTGWIRAQDVSTANVIESSRVADATITYQSPGPLGKPKQGIVSRVIGMVWP